MGAGEEKSAISKLLRPNGTGWTPERYARMYLYVWLYNKVAGNPKEFGLPNSNDNAIIINYIKKHYKELIVKYDFKGKLSNLDKSYGNYYEKFFEKTDSKGLTIFENEIGEFDAHALQFAAACGKQDGEMISAVDAANVLREVREDRRGLYNALRKSVEYKEGLLDKDTGKDKNGYIAVAAKEADIMRGQKLRPLRRARWLQFAMGALTAVAGAATLTGLGAFLGIGGAFLGGAGATFSAVGALGGTLGSLAATIGGFFISKTFLGKFLERRAEKKKLKKEYKEFMRGEGKYALKDGKVMGYRERKRELKKLWQERKAFEEYAGQGKDEYARIIRKKYKLLDPERVERILGDIKFTYDVTDSHGIFETILGEFGPEAAREDRANHNTVNDYKNRAAALLSDTREHPATVFELADELEQLGNAGEMFKTQQSLDIHQELQQQLRNAIVQGVRSIVDQPFNDQTTKTIKNALSDKRILEAIEQTNGGGDKKELQSLAKLIDQETGETKILDSGLGVTIKEQLSSDRGTMYGACERLGIETTPTSIVQIICKNIGKMTHQKERIAIENEINTKVTDEKVKTYLKAMLDRQTRQSKVDTTSLDPSVKNDIENMANLNNIEAIRTKINAISDPVKRQDAQKALDAQIKALSYKQKIANTLGAFGALSELADEDVIDYFEKISAITEYKDGFDGGELLTFKSKLEKIPNKALSRYMLMKLNEKVESTYITYAQSQSGVFASDAGKIRDFMIKVNQSQLLTESQKINVRSIVSKSLGEALDNELDFLIDHLYEYDATTSDQILKNYLTQKYSSTITGFKDFFDSKTPESVRIENKIKRIQNALSAKNLITVEGFTVAGRSGKPYLGPQSDDTRYFVKVFFEGNKDRVENKATDKLYLSAKNVENIYAKVSTVTFTSDRVDGTLTALLQELKNEMNKIMGYTATEMNDREKLAALLMIKRRVVGLFKAQMCKIVENKNDVDIPTFILTPKAAGGGKEYFESAKSTFNSEICTALDAEISRLESSVEHSGMTIKGAGSEINGIDANSYLSVLQTIDSGYSSTKSFSSGKKTEAEMSR